jgi:hypothetical protein
MKKWIENSVKQKLKNILFCRAETKSISRIEKVAAQALSEASAKFRRGHQAK